MGSVGTALSMTISDGLISLGALPSLLAACLVLLLGALLARHVALLARYSIPSPIVGGVLFALAAAMLFRATGHHIELQNATKPGLLLIFFACLGLTSDLRLLLRGGSRLLRFLAALIPFLLAQDALGVLMASCSVCTRSSASWLDRSRWWVDTAPAPPTPTNLVRPRG